MQYKMKNNITEKTNIIPVIKYETTGVLVAALNSKPKTHRFVRTNEADKRIYRVPVSVTKEMHEFLKEYSQVIGCSMTEILLRGLESISGYDGTNADKVIQAWKKHYEKM